MRERVINFLKLHPSLLDLFWKGMGGVLKIWSVFIPINEKRVIFASFGGRKFDDSPKALYDSMCNNDYFKDWEFIWAFVDPEKYVLNRGKKVKIDTKSFFRMLLSSKICISNSGMARGISFHRKGIIEVETWHGTPLKKIGGEEHQNSMAPDRIKKFKGKLDSTTIRCAQSEFDREIFSRIFHADRNAILMCDLPRNDRLLRYTDDEKNMIKENIGIAKQKKVILYTPTYREYLMDENRNNFIAPPINLKKWKKKLGDEYVLVFRAHYSVKKSLNVINDGFTVDATDYPSINDLYAIADIMISDYSSTYFDFSILERPMLCFAYDLKEYEEKRGLYLDIRTVLPCPVDENEDAIIDRVLNLDYFQYSYQARDFHMHFTPNAGCASEKVVDAIINRCEKGL